MVALCIFVPTIVRQFDRISTRPSAYYSTGIHLETAARFSGIRRRFVIIYFLVRQIFGVT
jgi:hypothetical protein